MRTSPLDQSESGFEDSGHLAENNTVFDGEISEGLALALASGIDIGRHWDESVDITTRIEGTTTSPASACPVTENAGNGIKQNEVVTPPAKCETATKYQQESPAVSRPKKDIAELATRVSGLRKFSIASVCLGLTLTLFCLWQGYQADLSRTKPIETIAPLDRVVVDAPQAALDADHLSSESLEFEEIGPETHRLLTIQAFDTWDDGTVDDINIKTVQPLWWVEENDAQVGNKVPLPLDLLEMGLPDSLQGTVIDVQLCPKPKDGTGRLVLTTVNHLNRDVIELTMRNSRGRQETLRPTGTHKFYSVTRNEWLSASELQEGEQLDGYDGVISVASVEQIPGTHRVYNMTVQGEHLYRVARCGVLVHNNECGGPGEWVWVGRRAGESLDFQADMAGKAIRVRNGVQQILEYRIPSTTTESGFRLFDDFADGVLIDYKNSKPFANMIDPKTGKFYKWFSGKYGFREEAIGQLADAKGIPVEWRVLDETFADALREALGRLPIKVVTPP